jgi:hypothetical protein
MHDITTGKLVMVIPGSRHNRTHNFITVSIVKPVTLERRVCSGLLVKIRLGFPTLYEIILS